MKYLFLDIDGVLNHEDWYINEVRKNPIKYKNRWVLAQFDPQCVQRLNKILDQTGARLVISSSWRSDSCLKTYFSNIGLTTDFDITPSLWDEPRGKEIEVFLLDHPCDQYVILDDDMDFTDEQIKNHLVHCCADFCQALQEGHEGQTGLTELKMEESINILNKM